MAEPAIRADDASIKPRRSPDAADVRAAARRISVIVTNYNYADYLREAIDSVLAQTYADVECIVVDDGSTDASRAIIAGYPRVKALLQANAGQALAAKAGLSLASGEIVIFLDADDLLHRDACSTVASRWQDGMSALFYRLQIIEGRRPTNRTWPDKPFLTAGEQGFVLRHGFIPSAPTTGNAFSKAHVAKVFGMAEGLDKNSFDMALTNAAPFTGGVATCDKPLGLYRIHDSNLTAYGRRQSLGGVKLGLYYAFHAQQTARRLAAEGGVPLPSWDFLAGPYNLKTYVLTHDFAMPGLDLPPRGALACAGEAARQFAAYDGLGWARRALNGMAVFVYALLPKALRKLVCQRAYAIDFPG